MKRLSAVLLIIALLITMMPLTAFADSPGTINVSNSSEILSAISAVSDGGTIALTSNIILLDFIDIDYGITKNITIDLNGHTLSHRDSDTTLIIKYGTGDLTIKDTSTSKSGLIIGNNNTGSIIELWDGLTKIESGTVKNWGSQSTVALYGDSNCEISGGTIDNAGSFGALEVATAGKLNIMGGTVTTTDDGACSLYVRYGEAEISGGTITATNGGIAVYTESITPINISDGTISSKNNYALSVENSAQANISGGTISSTNYKAIAIDSTGTVKITGGTPVIKGGTGAITKAPDLSGYTDVEVTASTDFSGTPVTEYNAASISTYKYLTFKKGEPTEYDIWVGGTRLTSHNLTGAGYSYTPSSSSTPQTLTLDGANITSSYNKGGAKYGIYTTDSLILELKNTNKVVSDVPATDKSSIGLYMLPEDYETSVDLIIKGTGTLTVEGGDLSSDYGESGGMYVVGSIIVDGATLIAKGKRGGEHGQSYGLNLSNGDMTIKKGSSVTAISGTPNNLSRAIRVNGVSNVLTVLEEASLTAIGGDSEAYAGIGIYFQNDSSKLVVAGGEVNTRGNSATSMSRGLMGNVDISDGTFTAESGDCTDSKAMTNVPNFTGTYSSGGYKVTMGESKDSATLVSSPTSTDYTSNKYVKVEPKDGDDTPSGGGDSPSGGGGGSLTGEGSKDTSGFTADGKNIVIRANWEKGSKDKVTINLPKELQEYIIGNKIINTIILVNNPDITVTLDLETVTEINKKAKDNVNITAERRDNTGLSGEAFDAVGNRPVFELTVTDEKGNSINDFKDGHVSVTIPYTLSGDENPEDIWAVYINEKGEVQWLRGSFYDAESKALKFSTNHFSKYAVGYRKASNSFIDINNHWAKNEINFAVSHGIFNGVSKTAFSPDSLMTRGMFVTTLGRLAEADIANYKKSSFSDIKKDDYYMGYIEWAVNNNIVKGTGGNKFNPKEPVTREQMAQILNNYLKAMNIVSSKEIKEVTFNDNEKISSYAKAAVLNMQKAGVIKGKEKNLFDPKGISTRAETAAVLRRLMETSI